MAPIVLQRTDRMRNRPRRRDKPMNLTIDTKTAANLRPPQQLKLPFSSPTTDEASDPENSSLASGSSGDRPKSKMVGRLSGIEAGTSLSKNEFEHALYVDLAKPKNQQETMQWYSSDIAPASGNNNGKHGGRRKSGISKRSQRPTGLQVVTNFSKNFDIVAAAKGKQGSDDAGPGGQPLLDLHGLKQLVRAREKQKMKTKLDQRGQRSKASDEGKSAENYTSPQSLDPGSAPVSGLSPSDGSVVIGMRMPFDESSTNDRKKNMAVQNIQGPPTPSILVTPADEESSWPSDSPEAELQRLRVASSVYSQPTPRILDEDIPPVPAIPELHSIVQSKEAKHILTAQNTPNMQSDRPQSTDTVFEDDSPRDQHVIHHTPTVATVLSPGLSDTNRHQSQGWWTYLLSPLLKRSSTVTTRRTAFSPRSIPPQSAISATFKDSTLRGTGEKEISHFSPDTPEDKFYQNADVWSTLEKQGVDESEKGIVPATHDVIAEQNSVNVFYNTDAGFDSTCHGLAAEYYQASAHDFTSDEPYFECVNHVCSMTSQKRRDEIIKSLEDGENRGNEKSAAEILTESPELLDFLAKLLAEVEKQKAAKESEKGVEESENPFSDESEKALSTADSRSLISLDGEAKTRDDSIASVARTAPLPSPPPSPSPKPPSTVEREPVPEPPRAMPTAAEAAPVPMPTPAPVPPAQMAPAPAPTAPPVAQPAPVPQMPPQMPPTQPIVVYPALMPAQVPAQMPTTMPPPSIPQQPAYQEPVVTATQQRTMSPVMKSSPPLGTIIDDTRETAPRGTSSPEFASRGIDSRNISLNETDPRERNYFHGMEPRGVNSREMVSRDSASQQISSPETTMRGVTPQEMGTRGINPRETRSREGTSQERISQNLSMRDGVSSEGRFRNMALREVSPPRENSATLVTERERQREDRVSPPSSSSIPPRRPSPAAGRGGNPTLHLGGSHDINDDSDNDPPPYYTPPTSRNSSRFPSNNQQGDDTRAQRSLSPGPVSPGLQRAMATRGGIPMSEVGSSRSERDGQRRSFGSGQLQDQHHGTFVTVEAIRRAEQNDTRRRRLRKEDSFWKRVGGLWRGRGCMPKKGCFGRGGREGRNRRRWCCVMIIFCIIVIVLSIVLAICLTHRGDSTPVDSQWLNLTGYPPMPTGIMTVAGPDPAVKRSSCVEPSQMWTCSLPKEEQDSNTGYASDRPNFRFEISFHNGSYPHSTTVKSSKTDRKRSLPLYERDGSAPSPTPAVPRLVDQQFLGNTTDNVTAPFEGEETPFFITFLSPLDTSEFTSPIKRDNSDDTESSSTATSPSTTQSLSPSKTRSTASSSTNTGTGALANIANLIPAPAMASDGTAAAATLYPFPESQPIRLYDRGKPTEHYGFYTYFDKSIFLESKAAVTEGNNSNDPDSEDSNGGSRKEKANVRCTWSQTRFLVRMWTQPTNVTHMRITGSPKSNVTNASATATATASATTSLSTISPTSTASSSANNFTSPGSFPYPITITIDRHGGLATEKLIYCYTLEEKGYYNLTTPKLEDEDRSSGGTIIQPSPGYVALAEAVHQGVKENQTKPVDGGTGGCECEWRNWVSLS